MSTGYQPSYPPSPQPFRHRFVLSKLLEIAAGLTIMYMLIEQYVAPLLGNSLQPIKLGQMTHVLERTVSLYLISPCILTEILVSAQTKFCLVRDMAARVLYLISLVVERGR